MLHSDNCFQCILKKKPQAYSERFKFAFFLAGLSPVQESCFSSQGLMRYLLSLSRLEFSVMLIAFLPSIPHSVFRHFWINQPDSCISSPGWHVLQQRGRSFLKKKKKKEETEVGRNVQLQHMCIQRSETAEFCHFWVCIKTVWQAVVQSCCTTLRRLILQQ